MPWYKLIPESWKKRACRYLLQRYVGHFLKEKLSLDQLSVDLYSGKGVIKELNLDVEALNEALESVNIPLEIVDGFIGSISVSIPWTSLLTDSTTVEVTGLELTIQPKQWDDSGDSLDTLSMLNSMHMTSSMQLAQEVLKSEKLTEEAAEETTGFEGVQMFAQTIDAVLSRIKMSFVDTTIRLEHLHKGADRGVALELKVERMEYFDDIATEQDGSPVDNPLGGLSEPAGIAHKNIHVMGVSLFFDEFFRDPSQHQGPDSPELSPRLYDSTASSMYKSTAENLINQSITTQPKSLGTCLVSGSQPIQVAVFSGRQELKAKLKQVDTLPGPKLELDCQLGAFHLLLSPRQLHGILEIFSGLASPANSDDSSGKKRSSKDKPMKAADFQRVEYELQRHLQTGRMEHHMAHMSPQTAMFMQEDIMMESIDELRDEDLYFSMHGGVRDSAQSEMESSFSSNYSGSTTKTASTATSFPRSESTDYRRPASSSAPKSPKDHIQKLLDDPSAELSRYRLKLSFISINLLHENPTSTPGDHFSPEVPASEKLKTISDTYFNKAKLIAFSGMTSSLKDLREKFSTALPYDHIGILGKPLTLECAQKTSQHVQSLSLDVTIGMFEATECLFDRRNFTSSMMGFSLPIDNKLPEYSQLLVFDNKDGPDAFPSNMYSSMHGGAPAFKLNIVTADRIKSSSKSRKLPKTNINFELGQFTSEIDITIVDRISALLSPEPTIPTDHGGGARFKTSQQQQTSVLGRQCFSQAMEEGPMMEQKQMDLHISSSGATLRVRFPIIDLRTGPQVIRQPWWQRNLHKEVLILEMKNFTFQTDLGNSGPQQKMEFMCSDISGFFQEDPNDAPVLLVSVSSDDGCDSSEKGFNWPRLVIATSQKEPSVLEDDQGDTDDSLPMDSLNGACQFDRAEPSPFSARKSMYEQEDLSSLSDKSESKHTSEEMVLPGDKEEMRGFQDYCVNNTKLLVDITLPIVTAFLPSRSLFEVLYNRVNNDLTLWEPSAPSPLRTQESMNLAHPANLDILHLLQQAGDQEKFQLTKSALQYDSGSDSDSEDYHYSIHDGRSRSQRTSKQQLPSKFCFSLSITKGKLLMVTPHKEEGKHGEVCLEVDEAVLFSVISYNGDPDLRYLCFQSNKAAMSNNGYLGNPVVPGNLEPLKQDSLPAHLEPRIYKSEMGVASKAASCVGRGPDSPDMISLAIKIKLDTINNTKDFIVSVNVRGGTLRHKMVASGESWISQCLDFLDVKDYPILGYMEPKVITELHVHLWSCAVDYRPFQDEDDLVTEPVHLAQRAMLTAETFSISSNIVAQSPTTLLRFHLDDAALFLSNKNYMEVNLRRDYVCVADLERFELSLRTSDGKDQKFPKTDLRISTNRVNIRTCADSCKALTELIRYFADDGDLFPADSPPLEEAHLVSSNPSRESSLVPETVPESYQMSESRLEHVSTMMVDAMQESEASSSSSESPERQGSDNKTQVFFLPNTQTQGQGQVPPAGLRPIVISTSAESVTSSTLSDRTEKLSDDEEFCIIDDPGWGIAPRDGQPVVRVLTKGPVCIKDNYFSQPLGKTDQLKPPEHFPPAEYRYTLKELTLVWYMYGGMDFSGERADISSASSSPKHPRLPGHGGGGAVKKPSRHPASWHSRGGPQRDLNTLMELQLTKVRCQHEVYPVHTRQASRQVLIIAEFEVRDRLATSQINKFLYQYTSENMPKQTHANMLVVKALHTRPESSPIQQECALRVSLLPLRLNIDQDALFFLRKFFIDLSGGSAPSPHSKSVPVPESPVGSPKPGTASSSTPPAPPAPVMAVNLSPEEESEQDQQDLLIMFDEMNLESNAGLNQELSESTSSSTGSDHGSQPVFFKSFIFSPDVPIRLDYHGKRVDMEQGTFAGLLVGLAQLNSSELKLKRLNYKHGLLGMDKLAKYAVSEWLNDIKKTQLPSILGGVGPMYSFVQIVHGVRDLFWLPVEQYRKDGRIVRGIQRGASSFTTSTAMALLELTNKLVQSIQYVAELTYDMLSPGPSVRKAGTRRPKQHVRRGQPSDMREGMTNAYIVIREGISDTAQNLVRAATEEQEQKGLTGVVGGVLRQIPPTIVQPVIIASEATSKVLGGMRNQLRPEAKKEDEDKWREGDKS
ncbi:autophagy-related protein 2 homolog A-like isoform X1 [Haliotis rufescens]|uniref:autophagy-related protein 2 homolog A-like isoform X1 n=1 Tax=Haliotis rufescens TaxID=6454 RepID=UPI001EB09F5F|nr:autophagy-related protein 2 homolog A-like isoform X1 [Haliotis rufescens]